MLPQKLQMWLMATNRLPRSHDPIALAKPFGDFARFRLNDEGQTGETVASIRSKVATVCRRNPYR